MKRMILTDTHIDRDGNINLRWVQQMSDDGVQWVDLQVHRVSVQKYGDIDGQLAVVDAHVKSLGFENGVEDSAKILAYKDTAWGIK